MTPIDFMDRAAERNERKGRPRPLLTPKVPPHSEEAEMSVLGGMMLDTRGVYEVLDIVTEDDFYFEKHRIIFKALCVLANQSRPCDFVTVSDYLRNLGKLDEVEGMPYLGQLVNDTPGAANVTEYARIVRERAVLRGLVAAGDNITELAFHPEGRGATELLDVAEQQLTQLRGRDSKSKSQYVTMQPLMEALDKKLKAALLNPGGAQGLPTGFTRFDEMTNGLHAGDLVIVAGRPSMGKCLAHDSELVLDDGSVATIEDIYRRRDSAVGTLRDNLRLDRLLPSAYVDDGHKPIFEVTTRLGRQVKTTLPHPFLTLQGWKPLAELSVGDTIAVPRELPVFGDQVMRSSEIRLLGYLIGDGGLTGSSPRFTTTNPTIERDFLAAVAEFGGLRCTHYRSAARAPSFAVVADALGVAEARTAFAARFDARLLSSGRSAASVAHDIGVSPASVSNWRRGRMVPGLAQFERLCQVLTVRPDELAPQGLDVAAHNRPNGLSRWLADLGLNGKGAGTKFIPAPVFRLPREQMAEFLRHLFATDGWATVLASGQAQLGYASISERLARQVSHLLLRFGVIAKLRLRWVRYRDARRPSWQLDITHAESIRRFIAEIGIYGKEAAVERVRHTLDSRREHSNTDLIPVGIWHELERVKGAMSWAELARRAGVADSNIHVHRRGLSRARLARFAMVLGAPHLADIAGSDVYWDRIESIIPDGVAQVYDLTIPDTHNFIANDICVHNTSFAMNIAEHAALEKKLPTLIFSMEMSAEQLGIRVVSSFGRVDQQRLRTGEMDDMDWSRFSSALGMIQEAPLFIDETGGLSPLDLRSRARRVAGRHGLSLIVVDYIQLMQVPGSENRTNEVSEISRNLKSLAKELNVPIIALSQLNRGLENRDNKRPRMADLRESGGIEQDADVIVFIYRDEVYNKDTPDKGTAELIIAKQRNGPTGTCKTAFLGQFTRFDNLSTLAPPGYEDYQ